MRLWALKGIIVVLLPATLAVAPIPADAAPLERICLIDEDCLDNSSPAILELAANGDCGGGDPAVCVNDQLANPGLRALIPLVEGTILGNGVAGGTVAPLLTGQIADEGLFWLHADDAPQSWTDAGPTTDPLFNFLLALADGFGLGGEFLLDNIPNVIPLGTAELESMVGETCCAVVYDSDVSINYASLMSCPPGPETCANLQGANLGLVNMTVLDVGEDPEGSVLPDITIRIEDGSVCQEPTVSVGAYRWGKVKAAYR